jgi:hypothetical protein
MSGLLDFVPLTRLVEFVHPSHNWTVCFSFHVYLVASTLLMDLIRVAVTSLYTPTTVRLCGSHRAANRSRVQHFSRNGDRIITSEQRGKRRKKLKGKKRKRVVNTRSDWDLICIHVAVPTSVLLCVNSTKKEDASVSAAGPHVCILTLEHDVFAKQYICEYTHMGHKVTDTGR